MQVHNQMALLKNLRNIEEAGVSAAHRNKVRRALSYGPAWEHTRLLPFRFVSAAKHAPSLADVLSDAMLKAIDRTEMLKGSTAVVIDVSGSMDVKLSAKSEMTRLEACAALAALVREVCDDARVFTFSTHLVECQAFRGLAMIDGVSRSQDHGGTYLAAALKALFHHHTFDRVIVLTDEQSHDGIIPPSGEAKGYLINVAGEKPALMTGKGWVRINGFSERLVDWIRFEEAAPAE